MIDEALTAPERTALEKAEGVIAAGVKTVFAVGAALQTIRDGKLYRATHATFAEYCKDKWGFVRQRAYQLIEAAEAAENLSTAVDKRSKTPAKPANEKQMRPLAALPKEKQKEAWAEATKTTDKPTEQQVRIAVEVVTKPKDKPSDKLPKDDRGVTLPANKVALWNRRGEMKEHAKAISVVRCALEKAQKDDDPLYAHINFSSIKADLDRSFHALASSAPYCVCPMCQGQGCRACKKTGLIGKFQFKTFVPKELKKVGE